MINLLEIILTVIGFATFDWWWLNVKKKYIYNHTFRWCLRASTVLILGQGDLYITLAMGLFFAATFDSTLNFIRGLKIIRLGNTAYWDKFWNKHFTLYKIMITVSLIASITILIIK